MGSILFTTKIVSDASNSGTFQLIRTNPDMLKLTGDYQSFMPVEQITTEQLIRNLGRFPRSVLPIGLIRELHSRGDAIHDPLATTVRKAVESVGGGLGSEPNSVFFAFGLLVPIAKQEDQALIESLLMLPEKSIDFLLGDLLTEAMPRLVAGFFEDQNASEVLGWIKRMVDQPELNNLNAGSLFRGMTLAVSMGNLERLDALELFVNRLEERSDQRYDLQSALIIGELMDLSDGDTESIDVAVRSSFAREQIDTDHIRLVDWESVGFHGLIDVNEDTWNDPASELSTWYFSYCSEDLDPIDATYRVNDRSNRSSQIAESAIPYLVDQIRQSTDDNFPQDAVESADVAFANMYTAIIEMIREEVDRYDRDSEAWVGTGAYLGLVLTISGQMPLPTDLLQKIMQLPQDDREALFGDQFDLIVQAVALTPLPQYEFVEQWIWDANRSAADRREMVEVYMQACHQGNLDREFAIDALVAGLRRALDGESMLITSYAEQLAFFTSTSHQQILEEAFGREDVEYLMPLDTLRRMSQDAEFAKKQVLERARVYRNAKRMITEGVMFGSNPYKEKPSRQRLPRPALKPALQPVAKPAATTTTRSDDRTPRNAQCPCGSGKKYKKCCMRQG
ncbi:SEC-C metal-binding domain-containing protein [Rubripirellula obstinata]|uniref:SEC-C metal-binding domain-containing protein n=1 Tax=Rubripirellula obstinata TaxID=406547 RepID=UPI00192E3B5A|nr:SEC-C metal-binding domain-containing protein [Rubripirellula obstinata]